MIRCLTGHRFGREPVTGHDRVRLDYRSRDRRRDRYFGSSWSQIANVITGAISALSRAALPSLPDIQRSPILVVADFHFRRSDICQPNPHVEGRTRMGIVAVGGVGPCHHELPRE